MCGSGASHRIDHRMWYYFETLNLSPSVIIYQGHYIDLMFMPYEGGEFTKIEGPRPDVL